MELIYNPDLTYLDIAAADIIAHSTRSVLKTRHEAIWALPGGRSVGNIFERLSERDDVEWGRVHFFMADERLVSIEDSHSNFRLLIERILYPLLEEKKITRSNMHPFIYRPQEDDVGTLHYEKELLRYGGKYDLLLLSSGEDGHIAGLYPHHHSVMSPERFFITMDDSPKPPPGRMSSSRNLLLSADTAVLLFYGKGKKNALAMFKDDKLTFEQCPAKVVQEIKNSFVLTDQK